MRPPSFDQGSLERIELEDTYHFQIKRDLLNQPTRYWQHLEIPEGRRRFRPLGLNLGRLHADLREIHQGRN